MAPLRFPLLTLALVLAIGSPGPASAGVRLGAISAGGGFGYAPSPLWPGYGYPLFAPRFAYWPEAGLAYSPYFAPIYLVPQADKGQVSLRGSANDAEVYLDNAYAGTAGALKQFWLAPGVYELEVRPKDQSPRKKRIYVLTGKTLKVSLE